MDAIIVLPGQLAKDITIEKAIHMNEQGYAVTAKYGKVLAERENQREDR